MIPRKIHIIWVGDESKRPENCIQTWRDLHPDWEVKIWGNIELKEYGWYNARHMKEMAPRELNGVADMMRWEIIYNEGGLVVDADSACIRRLDNHLLEHDAFACWENELARPGLIAAGYVGASAGNEFIGQIIMDINKETSVIKDMAWKTVGPLRLTEAYKKYAYMPLSILPSHYFIPEHFSGIKYTGNGPIYARQYWGSTRRIYDTLHQAKIAKEKRHDEIAVDC